MLIPYKDMTCENIIKFFDFFFRSLKQHRNHKNKAATPREYL